jgi:hypothetical protein
MGHWESPDTPGDSHGHWESPDTPKDPEGHWESPDTPRDSDGHWESPDTPKDPEGHLEEPDTRIDSDGHWESPDTPTSLTPLSCGLTPRASSRTQHVNPRTLFPTPVVAATRGRHREPPSSSTSLTTRSSHTRNSSNRVKECVFRDTPEAAANLAKTDLLFQQCSQGCGEDASHAGAVTVGATMRHVKNVRADLFGRVTRVWSLLREKRRCFFTALRSSEVDQAGKPVRCGINVPGTSPQRVRISLCVDTCLPALYHVSNPSTGNI